MRKRKVCLFLFSIVFLLSANTYAAKIDGKIIDVLSEQEQGMKDQVDHWGLPFTDQLSRFLDGQSKLKESLGAEMPENFIIGLQHGLEKIPLRKYWFKGEYTNKIALAAAKNEYENFQVAVMPGIGKTLQKVTLSANNLVHNKGRHTISAENITIYRVGYVETMPAQYPSLYKGMWPDILLPNAPIEISGSDLGLFWVEIKVPEKTVHGDYKGTLELRADNEKVTVNVELHVYDFSLPDRVPFPIAVWTNPVQPWGDKISVEDYRWLCGEFLKHGIDPVAIGRDFVSLEDNNFEVLDKNLEYCFDRGLQLFEVPRKGGNPEELKSYVEHIRRKGWIDKALIYIGPDEPDEETFRTQNISLYQKFHSAYPDIEVFLASGYHQEIDKGCDIWMTDVSTDKGAEFASKHCNNAKLWFYFCHLPVRIDFHRPLVQAPNMLIDNEAVEHRIALWLCWKYQAKGMFIYAGNAEWRKPDVDRKAWEQKGWELSPKSYGYPYAGVHNGNGYLIYPGPNPSIRLKVLRDGLEDLGYLSILKNIEQKKKSKKFKREAEKLLSVPPEVLVDAHYFNRNPKALLEVRNKIAELIEKGS